jgi:hypothetical protein
MMEPLSHYHCEIYYCKPVPINLHQTTYTNNLNHASTMHQPVPQPVINLYHKKCINHAPTYTKQPVINLYHKQVHQPCTNLYLNLYHEQVHQPCTNLYHEQVHQPCTKPVQITCHNNLSKQPITKPVSSLLSTKSDLLTKINHQDNSQRCASTKHNTTTHNHHQDQYVLLIIYQYKYDTSSINHVSTILLTSASNHVPSMYQKCIN